MQPQAEIARSRTCASMANILLRTSGQVKRSFKDAQFNEELPCPEVWQRFRDAPA